MTVLKKSSTTAASAKQVALSAHTLASLSLKAALSLNLSLTDLTKPTMGTSHLSKISSDKEMFANKLSTKFSKGAFGAFFYATIGLKNTSKML